MNEKLQRARAMLADRPHRVIELPGPVVRTADVIDQVDINPNHIIKTIVFKRKTTGNAFAVCVRGKDRISYKKLRHIIQDKISALSPKELEDNGWLPGECCPLTIPGPLYVDPTVLEIEVINTGSGDLNYGLEYPSKAIIELREDVHIKDVKEE